MTKHLIITIITTCLITLSGCSPPERNEAVREKPHMVRTEKIIACDLPVTVNAVGRLIPNREVVISSQVAGIVMAIADMKTMRIKAHLNERDYVHLDKDDPVTVRIEKRFL